MVLALSVAPVVSGCDLIAGLVDNAEGGGTGGNGGGGGNGGNGGTKSVNGCEPGAVFDTGALGIDITGGDAEDLCWTVHVGTPISFFATGAPCWLRGGEGGADPDNPIEEATNDAGVPLSDAGWLLPIDGASPPCVPYYCDESPDDRQGAIFFAP